MICSAESGAVGTILFLSRRRIVSRSYLCRTNSEEAWTESLKSSARDRASGNEVSLSCHVCSMSSSNCCSAWFSLHENTRNNRQNDKIYDVFLLILLPTRCFLRCKVRYFLLKTQKTGANNRFRAVPNGPNCP